MKKLLIVVIISIAILSLLEVLVRKFILPPLTPITFPISDIYNQLLHDTDSTISWRDLRYNYGYTDTCFTNKSIQKLPFQVCYMTDSSRNTGTLDTTNQKIDIYGCSFTFGLALADTNTHPYMLQQLLPNYSVRNMGICGASIAEIYYHFINHFDKKNTLCTIINYAYFQTQRYPDTRYRKRQYYSYGLAPIFTQNKVYHSYHTIAAGTLKDTIADIELSHMLPSEKSALINLLDIIYTNKYAYDKHHYDAITLMTFKAINDTCKKYHSQLIVTNIDGQVATNNILTKLQQTGITTLDYGVNTLLNKYNFAPTDMHPNTNANKIYAEKLYHHLNKNLVFK